MGTSNYNIPYLDKEKYSGLYEVAKDIVDTIDASLKVVSDEAESYGNWEFVTLTTAANTTISQQTCQYNRALRMGYINMEFAYNASVTAGARIAVGILPEGYRPSYVAVLSCAHVQTGAITEDCAAFVHPNGNVYIRFNSNVSSGTAHSYLQISGVYLN